VTLKIGLALLILGLASSAGSKSQLEHTAFNHSHDFHQPCTFFPPNNLRFPVRSFGQMPEHTFRRIVQVVDQIYSPLFRQAGHPPLYISPRWTDDTVNAFATICNQPENIGKKNYPPECAKMQTSPGVMTPFSLVVMFGGLARHPLMTGDGFILVACHEIGHHLGGFPRYGKNTEWPSTEGQSDYFATAKCARHVFQALGGNEAWLKTANVDFEIRRSCQANFPNSMEEAAICMRSAMAGLSLARTLGSLNGPDYSKINFSNTDKSVVRFTFEGHPEAQCRLDTYLAGSLCRVSADQAFGFNDSRTGSCHPLRVEHVGSRPACWFSDAKAEGFPRSKP
jgi:hypothetical protein